jgi:glutamyl-tRNA(Gln) amidotransferase subunit E
MSVDYSKLGLKVGLEIHQQLDTSTKLFCNCQPELSKEESEVLFLRRLRPTQSELGQVDPAAFFEFQKGVKILYEANNETSCLVEMDEEPPHPINLEAVEIALTVALMMKATPIDEIHVMRKTVIDGSNTTGFQRTCLIALGGEIYVGEKRIPIEHVSLEEDAARKTGQEGKIIRYRIDRLGIPLIEIATAPVIYSPKETEQVALAIGRILRATGKVKRGLGTIRQDLNISIPQGALIEIKGVQELEILPLVVEYEVKRQLRLLEVREELKKRGLKEDDIEEKVVDVTQVFQNTKCKVISKALGRNLRVLAVHLPKFAGLLKRELAPDLRLGTEMADRARFWGRVGGIFHTDELPAYGITLEEVKRLKETVNADEMDAVVFVADNVENAEDALRAVVERAREALRGVPEETRAAKPDGTTRYMRPRPGAARMYPETDIPPIKITAEHLESIRKRLPELPEQKLNRLMQEYGLNKKLAKQVLDSEYGQLFETIAMKTKVSPTTIAAFLTEKLKAMKREGIPIENVSDNQFLTVFSMVGKGELAKEAVEEVVAWLSKNENATVEEAIEKLGLKMLSMKDLERVITETLMENADLVKQRGSKAFAPLMGMVMRKVRGKAKAQLVSQILKRKLEERGNC